MAELAVLINNIIVHRFALNKARLIIGRSQNADIVLDDSSVSSQHAELTNNFNEQGKYLDTYFKDLNSTNGSLLNQSPVLASQLKHNDLLTIGSSQFKLICADFSDTTTLLKPYDQANLPPKDMHLLNTLTSREVDVLLLMGQDLQRKVIANELNLSVHTISDHIKVIYKKLNISSKQEAIALAKYIKN